MHFLLLEKKCTEKVYILYFRPDMRFFAIRPDIRYSVNIRYPVKSLSGTALDKRLLVVELNAKGESYFFHCPYTLVVRCGRVYLESKPCIGF